MQETLIAVHTRRASYDRARPFSAWLFAIARYRMIDHFRRTRENCALDEFEDELVAEGFEDEIHARMDVASLMATLPERQAQAIYRTRIEGFSVSETAQGIGIGESAAKVSIHRGLKSLAARILRGRP